MPKMWTAPQREHDFDGVLENDTLEKTHGASTGARFASFRAKMDRKWRELTPTLSSYEALSYKMKHHKEPDYNNKGADWHV